MDFGLMGMEGLVGQQETGSPDPDGKRKWSGSGFFKQERSGSGSPEEEDPSSRAPKVAKNGLDLGLSKALAMQQQELLMRSTDGGLCRPPQSQMLSFASPTPQLSFLSISKDGGGGDKASQTLPYYQHLPSPVYSRNAGYASGSMHGSFTGIRGPFTPAQWIELEHQALIYKYLTANVPVPSTLLVPIRKALNSSGFSGFSAGSFPAHPYGWGPFHLGYSGSTDPEPGRCRRTDGKKWRCSRDAVPDQKYCERHINRGRHRSRKPVEGQSGQAAASGPTNPKVVPLSSATSSTVASGGSASNSLAIVSHQLKSLQAGAPDPETDPVVNRYKRLQDPQGLSMMPTTINLKPNKDSSHFSIPEQKNPYKPLPEFGFVSTDALLNPLPKNYNSFLDFNNDHLKSDWTQLSMMPSELSSPPSPNEEKLAPSPLRLSHELNQRQMGLGVGNSFNEAGPKQHGNWIPVSWGNSMGGGPLGEVLNNTGSAVGSCKSTSSSALNLMGEGWNGSPQLDSSPTGVLQKGAFVSLSNSGSGSSPADDNKKTQETGHLADELLGSAHVASSIPTL